jgi:uncharacterized membrane protein HdeD (DUF308 family)
MIATIHDARSLALRGLAALVFGVMTLVWPGITLTALVLLWGFFALVDGMASLMDLVNRRAVAAPRWPLVVRGIAGVAAGIITWIWPGITALALLYVIAAWAFVIGMVEIATAVEFRRELEQEWILGLAGALSIVFAVLLVITPGAGALAITWLIGWYAIVVGAVFLATAWEARGERPARIPVTVRDPRQRQAAA